MEPSKASKAARPAVTCARCRRLLKEGLTSAGRVPRHRLLQNPLGLHRTPPYCPASDTRPTDWDYAQEAWLAPGPEVADGNPA